MVDENAFELRCPACTWYFVCQEPEEMDRYLRAAGFLLDKKTPSRRALEELLQSSGSRLVCPDCRTVGLEVAPYHAGEGEWQEAVTCESCRKPIPPERLEALPDTRRCVQCQQAAETGTMKEEPEYCPKCGAPMILRVSRSGGTTRYKLFCTGSPPCRL